MWTRRSPRFTAYDGNGNVTGLFNSNDGTLLCQYEYGPFGELIRATGPMAKANPFRLTPNTRMMRPTSSCICGGLIAHHWVGGSGRDPVDERGRVTVF